MFLLAFHVFRLRNNLKLLLQDLFAIFLFIYGFMVMKVTCTYDVPNTCYFPAHIGFFNFIELMIEGRLQAKTSVVSPFISVTGHTYVGMGQ